MRSCKACIVATIFLLSACGSDSNSSVEQQEVVDISTAADNALNASAATGNAVPTEPAKSKLAAADRSRVCRAAVADLNGHSPSIVKLMSDDGEIARVRYNRPDDGKQWVNECRFDGDRILWRTVDAFGSGSGAGRWRESAEDETITFSLDGTKVTITTAYSDGSGGSETYSVR